MTDLVVVQRSPTIVVADGPAVPVPHATSHGPAGTDPLSAYYASLAHASQHAPGGTDPTWGVPRSIVVNRRTFFDSPATLSDGVATSQFTRLAFVPVVAGASLRLVYANHYFATPLEADGPNSITVKAAIETEGLTAGTGRTWPAYFNGVRSVVIPPGAIAVSDPIPVQVTAGQICSARTYVTVASGEKWPMGYPALVGNIGTAGSEWAGTTDIVDSGNGVYSTTAQAYGPSLILADKCAPAAVVGVLGDSISHGTGDTPKGRGLIAIAFDASLIPIVNVSTDGESAHAFVQNTNKTDNGWRRLRLLENRVTHWLSTLGRNDVSAGTALATIQADMQLVWAKAAARGLKVYQSTITPRTTSTDSWATLGNQTVHSSEAVRVALNDWLRTVPAGLTGCVEVADTVESSRNSGKWKAPGYTADGIHPTATGHVAAAAAIPTTWPLG